MQIYEVRNYEVKDGKGQHVFYGYQSIETLLDDIATWFNGLKNFTPGAFLQIIQFEYDDKAKIEANVFWGYDSGRF